MKPISRSLLICTLLTGLAGTQWANAATVAYWGFEEGSGTVAGRVGTAGANDDPINGALGTDFTWNGDGAPGVGGSNSLNFTGGIGRIESAYAGIGGSATRSVSLWVRTTTTGGGQSFVTWGDSQGGNGRKWHVRMNDNVANGEINAVRTEIQGSFEIGSVSLIDGNWHHVASVYSAGGSFGSGQVMHYIDGILVANSGDGADTVAVNTVLFGDAGAGANATPVWIGARMQGAAVNAFTGDLDEIYIFDHALSLSEVQALAGIPEPSGVALLGIGAMLVLRRRRIENPVR